MTDLCESTGGITTCDFDGPTVAGDFVVVSTKEAWKCHDTGSFRYPDKGQILGHAMETKTEGGTGKLALFCGKPYQSGGCPACPECPDKFWTVSAGLSFLTMVLIMAVFVLRLVSVTRAR